MSTRIVQETCQYEASSEHVTRGDTYWYVETANCGELRWDHGSRPAMTPGWSYVMQVELSESLGRPNTPVLDWFVL